MYNRYIGNTGRRYRIDEGPSAPRGKGAPAQRGAQPVPDAPGTAAEKGRAGREPDGAGPRGRDIRPPRRPEGLFSSLRSLVPALPFGLDAGDLLLLLMLLLLYTESGDEDFLIILAVVAFSFIRDA